MIKRSRKVTPTTTKAVTYDEESWKPSSEETVSDKKDLSRTSEVRQSKTKRVKNYLKKCKTVLGSSKSNSIDIPEGSQTTKNTSWYLENVNECEVNELEDVFEEAQVCLNLTECSSSYQVANVIEVRGPPSEAEGEPSQSNVNYTRQESEETKLANRGYEEASQSNVSQAACFEEEKEEVSEVASPTLSDAQGRIDGENEESGASSSDTKARSAPEKVVKGEVECLVDRYFGDLYENYEHSRKCLVRQARNLLVCEYHGCLQKFEGEFCVQAEKLLRHLKNGYATDTTSPLGWPLCIGRAGIVVHLCPLDQALIRYRDCYLCLQPSSASEGLEVALVWRQYHQVHSSTIAKFKDHRNLDDIMCSGLRSVTDLEITSYDDYDGQALPEMLQNLLVSVEHAIKRVPLDDLVFPCPQCLQYLPLDRSDEDPSSCACQCSCRMPDSPVSKKDTSIQTSPMFEYVGSIPHIDSDEDDEKDSVKSGAYSNDLNLTIRRATRTSSKKMEIARPKAIRELPDKLLMSGINLPGTTDTEGRPIILCYAECIARAGLNKYEIAKLLLYYSSIPT
ncbi:unnamed protein product [Callosobruchus maculatus]|uniref:Uncharacterized protein n=1 Tax=Callosobruchus maculatus TaxID=64391 RepID=A0A653DPG7_CALMS|nr:unnamed protein product [Callosobruchus maculatus]